MLKVGFSNDHDDNMLGFEKTELAYYSHIAEGKQRAVIIDD